MTRTIPASRLQEVADANTPPGVRVVYRKSLSGRAYYSKRMISVPRPTTREALYIFLHECGHFFFDHGRRQTPEYLDEIEAEHWAHARMREAGIPVPRKMTAQAKKDVARAVADAHG
jgi:hypothetical protein